MYNSHSIADPETTTSKKEVSTEADVTTTDEAQPEDPVSEEDNNNITVCGIVCIVVSTVSGVFLLVSAVGVAIGLRIALKKKAESAL